MSFMNGATQARGLGPTGGWKGQMQLSLGVPVLGEEAEPQKPRGRKGLEKPLEPSKLGSGSSLGRPLGISPK